MIATIDDLRRKALSYALVLLWLMVPLVGAIGIALGQPILPAVGLVALVAALVSFEARRKGAGLGSQMAASAGLAIGVSAIVYLLRGHPWQTDGHMIFFAAFALTAVFCDWRPIITFASVIAVHHLALNFLFTQAVFPGEASLGRVVLHAVVLVAQAVPLVWLSAALARLFEKSDLLLDQANAAQLESRHPAEGQMAERKALDEVISHLSRGLRDLSEGNLTRPITTPFSADCDGLRQDFNATLDRLADTMVQVVDASQGIRSRSTEISSASEDLSRRTENQAAALEQTAAALDQMTTSVRAAAEGAREVEGIVGRARQEAEESRSVVDGAVSAMSEIAKSSQQISQIIGAIDDIAFQTNLLALNAGVEAARAGDAGKGFAVVASEVRALAQRSSSAAKEIKTLISTSAQHVDRGVDQVGKAGQALTKIVDSVAGISSLVSNIATGARDQSSGLAEINIGVTQLDQVTQQNAAMVEESTAASDALQQEATALAGIVSRFRVPEGQVRKPAAQPLAQTQRPAPPPEPAPLPEPPRQLAANSGPWQDF